MPGLHDDEGVTVLPLLHGPVEAPGYGHVLDLRLIPHELNARNHGRRLGVGHVGRSAGLPAGRHVASARYVREVDLPGRVQRLGFRPVDFRVLHLTGVGLTARHAVYHGLQWEVLRTLSESFS